MARFSLKWLFAGIAVVALVVAGLTRPNAWFTLAVLFATVASFAITLRRAYGNGLLQLSKKLGFKGLFEVEASVETIRQRRGFTFQKWYGMTGLVYFSGIWLLVPTLLHVSPYSPTGWLARQTAKRYWMTHARSNDQAALVTNEEWNFLGVSHGVASVAVGLVGGAAARGFQRTFCAKEERL